MKKILVFSFIFLSFFIVNASMATSGACSYHGGVNCDSGADVDGSVICNDGWRDSSVNYIDSSECADKEFYCTQDEYDEIKKKYQIDRLLVDLSIANNAMEAKYKVYKDFSSRLSGASLIYGSAAQKSNLLLTEARGAAELVLALQDNINDARNLAKAECLAVGKYSHYKNLSDILEESAQNAKNDVITCPDNSYMKDKFCYCNYGYSVLENKCILDAATSNVIKENNIEKNDIVISPANLNNLLSVLNENRNEDEESKYNKIVESDLSYFNISMSSEQKNSVTNFIVYGISSSTKILGPGERRALIRDYFDTVAKEEIYWDDLDNLARGKKIVVRNLEKEKRQSSNVLKIFKKIFGHNPKFNNESEDLAWNTLMYRIRFKRDLEKEENGIESFKNIFKYSPNTPLDWAAVRVLGYVK